MEAVAEEARRSVRSRVYWLRTVGYWLCTLVIANEMIAGSMWDLLHAWAVPIALAVVMLVAALLTLPKGASPGW